MSASDYEIVLSGFSDEAAADKTLDQQFAAMAALGLKYFSLRFVDFGNGVKNVLDFEAREIATIRERMQAYGLRVSSIGSPIGKVKLVDEDDGSQNVFVPFEIYLKQQVASACRVANELNAKLIRGFSFYPPWHQNPDDYMSQAIDRLGRIADRCDAEGLTFGLEVEANLVGNTGYRLAKIHRSVGSPALVLVFDGGNLVTQGFDTEEVLAQFRAMLNGLGWLHVKDYRPLDARQPSSSHDPPGGVIDEDALHDYVPADRGGADYATIFQVLRSQLPDINRRIAQRDIPGFFVDLEPHLRGGGQFGGFSGADGMGVALRALCGVLQRCGLDYRLTDFDDLHPKSKR